MNLNDLVSQLQFITNGLAVLSVFITAGAIMTLRDWRLILLVLLGQYLAAGFLLARVVSPEIALVKIFIGALTCTMLYLSARQAGYGGQESFVDGELSGPGPGSAIRQGARGSLPFRVLCLILVLIVVIAVNQSVPLPQLPPDVAMGTYWLIFSGVLVLISTERPLWAAPGLLTTVTGFELLYTPLERSLTIVWLWAAATLLLAVGISYLILVRGGNRPESLL